MGKRVLYIPVPDELHSQVKAHVAELGTDITTWVGGLVVEGLRQDKGLPPLPPPRAPLPTTADIIRGVVTGEAVLEPCGDPTPCKRSTTTEVGDMTFCDECDLRIA